MNRKKLTSEEVSKIRDEIANDLIDYPTMHELKTWPEYFRAVVDGSKTFEVRINDRGFKVGDMLALYEWCPKRGQYTKECCIVEITYMTDFGQPDHQVVMAIRKVG